MFKYKPEKIQIKNTKLYNNVAPTAWGLGGQAMIDTQYEYSVVTEANLNRLLPEDSWIDAYSIPVLAQYGSVSINPAGIKLTVAKGKISYTDNLIRSVLSATAAMNSIIARQLTHLEIYNTTNAVDNNFPVILTYQLALVRNTQYLIAPLLHYQSLLAVLDSLENYTTDAAFKVNLIKKQLGRSKFVSALIAYLDTLEVTPLHKPTVDTLCEFFTVEKLNDALNTSYDFTCVTVPQADEAGYVVKNNASGKNVEQNLIITHTKVAALESRDYLLELIKLFNMNSSEFAAAILEKGSLWTVLNKFIEAFGEMTLNMAALPAVFSPYYAACDLVAEFVDTSVFTTFDVKSLKLPLRKANYYAGASVIANVQYTESTNSLYPVFDSVVPIYRGNLKPTATFDSNGVLLLNVPKAIQSIYAPFVDLSQLFLTKVWFATQTDFSEYLDWEKIPGVSYIPMYSYNFGFNSVVTLTLKKFDEPSTYQDVLLNPLAAFINYLVIKCDYINITIDVTGKNATYIYKSPYLTGARPVSYPTIVDSVLESTPTIIGIKSIIPMTR